MRRYLILCLALSCCSVELFAQSTTKPSFTVEGEVSKPLKLTQDDLTKMKPIELKAKDKEGKDHVYKGLPLFDILVSAGVTLGKELRGVNLSKYILITAADGYKVIYALPEIDPAFTSQTILLAYEVDGHPLPDGEGPFRIVAPNDKRPARWIRQLTAIRVVMSKE